MQEIGTWGTFISMNTILKADTIAAVATPPGEGGIAVIRVSGPKALAIAARLFRPMQTGDIRSFAGYTVHYGTFQDPATQEIVDDGLLTVFRTPRSYTGEDTVELSCHGGRVTTARVLQITLHAGARLAEPGEFTLRAFLNGRMDLAQAEAVADLVRARTELARRVARRQLEGALSEQVRVLKDELIGILAAIEVTIDFSEEVGELDYEALVPRINAVRRALERLLATADRGRLLREGVRVAIIGRPNVGKSSLLNALLRADRAIVTAIAGTTRDLVEETASLQGVAVVLVDTAGIRDTEDIVERIGVERAEGAAATADVVFFVLDAVAGVTAEDHLLAQRVFGEAFGTRAVLAVNKRDAVSELTWTDMVAGAQALLPTATALMVSARTGEGLAELEAALLAAAGGTTLPGDPSDETVLVAGTRHRQVLEAALRSLNEAEQTTVHGLPGDFIAIDIRGALDALGQITGETVTEDIIHRIFHDFCVGK